MEKAPETFVLDGPLTIYEVEDLKQRMLAVMEKAPCLVLDCSAATRCDTAFLQLLFSFYRTCVDKGIQLSLIPGEYLLDAAFRIGMDLSPMIRK
ncbi:STAS domain-containing protein [Desulfobotulus mexicanus]|uniref:STAS domain-containing protein n=1 Tax=Desulfobotulus mexicanus TaxID=2586642 RepID=A0A5Q4VAR1_9BACT|nr:STAS domain-containing protein [Desulfobotulus mexicanus]TYT74635.1 STAS domain-containing protein [Desulfobotulus mexicanus]